VEPLGIYTLANDRVYDQLIALLNSIRVNIDASIPICVIPFDQHIERVQKEVDIRPNITLFRNSESINRWEKFAHEFVESHPEAQKSRESHPRWYRGKLHRKFAAFDGIFEKFVFFDCDSLAMKPVTAVFEKLEMFDFVFDDWENAKSQSQAALNIQLIQSTGLFTESQIRPALHCSSFWGSKHGIFGIEELANLQDKITNQGEAAWVNNQGWWDDAFLFNYMTLRSERPLFNFTLSSDGKDRTGNCANSDPFVNVNQVLYNQEGLKPIHRIHYMGYSSTEFTRLVQGEDVDIRYRDIFLHYRFLENPEQCPLILKKPSFWKKTSRRFNRIIKKISSYYGL